MDVKNTFLAKLRDETMPLHKEVEGTAISQAIISPSVTKADYIAYLNKVLAIHTDLENIVFPVIDRIVGDLALRKKTPAIEADLLKLNHNDTAAGHRFLDNNYLTNNAAFSMGIMYVAEGSTLGGQFILKNIKAALGGDAPAEFLNVYSEKTGSLWKNFMSTLQDYGAGLSDDEKDLVIAGAVYGFGRVKHIFE